MSYTFFTADLHFNHTNIINFCKRPFKSVENMNDALIRNWNSRVSEDDTVYHVGDFCFKGNALWWEKHLNGKVIHIKGNHDDNNKVKTILTNCIAKFGDKVFLIQHEPPLHDAEIPDFVDCVICGHVHEKFKWIWSHNTFYYKNGEKIKASGVIVNKWIPIINVGVDVWNFRPVRMDELLTFYDTIIKEKDRDLQG